MKNLSSSLILILVFALISLRAYAFNACHADTYPFLNGAKFFTSSSKDKMAYRVTGPEEAETVVVFLNGLNKDMSQWGRVRDHLMKQHSDWAFVQTDLIGQGNAILINPEAGVEISYQRQILLLKELIATNRWQNKKLVLVGHSYGGGIAARFAAENPGWVKQNVLIAPFVDNLETHQTGLEGLGLTKQLADFMGMKDLYEKNVQISADIGMASAWYSSPFRMYTSKSTTTLSSIMALTRGIRNLFMNWSVSQAGSTTTHLVVSMADELIPERAHKLLWKQVPKVSQGLYLSIPATHDSVEKDPDLITNAIDQAVP